AGLRRRNARVHGADLARVTGLVAAAAVLGRIEIGAFGAAQLLAHAALAFAVYAARATHPCRFAATAVRRIGFGIVALALAKQHAFGTAAHPTKAGHARVARLAAAAAMTGIGRQVGASVAALLEAGRARAVTVAVGANRRRRARGAAAAAA